MSIRRRTRWNVYLGLSEKRSATRCLGGDDFVDRRGAEHGGDGCCGDVHKEERMHSHGEGRFAGARPRSARLPVQHDVGRRGVQPGRFARLDQFCSAIHNACLCTLEKFNEAHNVFQRRSVFSFTREKCFLSTHVESTKSHLPATRIIFQKCPDC